MKLRNIVFTFTILAFGASSVFAEQWQVLGTRPMGMGGAFVGMAKGPIAQYWNPAGLYQEDNVSGLELGVGIGIEFAGDIMENASQIGDLADDFSSIQSAQSNGGTVDADEMASFVKTMSLLSDMNEPGNGALFELAGGVNLKLSKIAISVNNFTSAGITPMIDVVNLGLGTSGAIAGIFTDGSEDVSVPTGAKATAAATIQVAISELGGYAEFEGLICGSAGCLATITAGGDAITNAATLSYAMVNASTLGDVEIIEAANTMSEYAADVAPIVAGMTSTNDYTDNTSNLTVLKAQKQLF